MRLLEAVRVHHTPVMVREVIEGLQVQPGGRYIDCTVGEGGHAMSILEASAPGGQCLGLDLDSEALEVAQERLSAHQGSFRLLNASYSEIVRVASELDFRPVNGILFDLGLSSLQVEEARRGFSLKSSGPLDMRFDMGQRVTADDIVNGYSEDALAMIISHYGEEPRARRIARAIIRRRPIGDTLELASVVQGAVGRHGGRIHPATRTFQALRMAVNEELKNLELGIGQALGLLGHQGRLVIISYHSLEDRLFKNLIRREAKECICPPETPQCICDHKATLRVVTKRVVTPSPQEVRENPRGRSAKMRVAEHV